MAGTSAWRVNDVVACDAMRESAATLTALLLESAHAGSLEPDEAQVEIAELRRAVLTVDAYDRAQVAELAVRISSRSLELSGAPS